MTGFELLARALDAAGAAGHDVNLWWRDDDLEAPSEALDHLLAALAPHGIVPALAAIPARLVGEAVAALEGSDAVVFPHGWTHANHAPGAEKSSEFGPHRPITDRLTDCRDARLSLSVIAGDRAERQKLLEVVAQLDIPVGEDGATQVVYLRFADAENLAPILEGYAEEANRSGKRAGAGKAASATRNQSQATVLADKDTNALIITAPPKTMRQIREVIAKLDIRRAQVLVEALIAEVSANKSAQLGVDWAVLNDERIAAAGILDPDTLSGLAAALAPNGSPAGLVSQGINIGAGRDRGDGTSFAVLIKALQGDGDSNILSTPTLVTLDNEEAEISVGQEVPFLTGSFSNTGVSSSTAGVVTPFQTIERKDVGLTLGITPQINEGNTIKLELELEISSLVSSATGAVDLITNKRTLNNTTSVDDGQVLVLGGLIDDSLDDTQRGVPFFSSIPVIGSLFQFRSINKVKRNLMIFIRPAILRKQAEGDIFSRRKYESLRSLQRSMGSTAVPLIGGERILLAPYDQFAERGSGTATEAEAEAGAQP